MMVGVAETSPLVNLSGRTSSRGGPLLPYTTNCSSDDTDTRLRVAEEGKKKQKRRARSKHRPIRPGRHAKEAIVYLGGIDHGKLVTRFVSSRLAAKLNQAITERDDQAMNQCVYTARGHFGYGKRLPRDSKEQYSDLFEFETMRYTVYLVDGSTDASCTAKREYSLEDTPVVQQHEWPIVDVFQLDYLDTMSTAWRENRSLFVQTMAMALAMFYYLKASTSAFFRIVLRKLLCCHNGSSGVLLGHVIQFSTVVFLFVLLLVYFAILITAVVQICIGLIFGQGGGNGDSESITCLQQITILATFLGFIAPQCCYQTMVDAVVDYTAVVFYLIGIGPLRVHLRARLDALMERIQEQWKYERIHIVAYSFGALLAIDALFPVDEPEIQPEYYKLVDHFVTFGCPFDMVRTLLPHYYSINSHSVGCIRQRSNGNMMRWTNFFVPGDALGSNFRNDSEVDRSPDSSVMELQCVPDKTIAMIPVAKEERTNVLDLLGYCLVNSIRVHVKHWSAQPDTRDVSNELVKVIFEDHWVLAEQAAS